MKCKYHRLITLLLLIIFSQHIMARTIVDMSGQILTVPEKITKLYATSPPSTYILYTIDPSLIIGLNFDHSRGHNESSNILDSHFTSLPIIGGLQGGASSINRETLLSLHPHAVISWNTDAASGFAASLIQSSGIPTINVNLEDIPDVPKAYRFLGELLEKQARTEKLATYVEDVIATTKTLVEHQKEKQPIVYYAQGTDGLLTECDKSSHYLAIKLAGGINPHICEPSSGKGMEKITLEQVILYNPEIIIVQEKEFFNSVKNDPRWRFITAVKTNRIYLVPKVPFNWIDRPPSFMRFLGLQWLTHLFYNAPTQNELEKKMTHFYKLFLDVELSEEQVHTILGR